MIVVDSTTYWGFLLPILGGVATALIVIGLWFILMEVRRKK